MSELVSKTFRHLCWDAATVSANAIRLLTSFVFLQQSEILYWENNLEEEFRELKQQNPNRYSRWTVGDAVTLLIISVVFRYLQLHVNFLFPTFLPDIKSTYVFVMFCILIFLVWFCSF